MTNETKEYVKKPIVVEAYQTDEKVEIETLEGVMTANPGDYIITGVKGEQYPCKPDVFEMTYDSLDAVCVEKECVETVNDPKMSVYNEYDFQDSIFHAAINFIRNAPYGFVYVASRMGSVKLDITNPQNSLEINKNYIEIFNAETGEVSMIKTSEITGFVFEPPLPSEMELEDEVEYEDD